MELVVTYAWNGVEDSENFDISENPYDMDFVLPRRLKEKLRLRETPRVQLISVYDPSTDELIEFAVDEGGQWVGGE